MMREVVRTEKIYTIEDRPSEIKEFMAHTRALHGDNYPFFLKAACEFRNIPVSDTVETMFALNRDCLCQVCTSRCPVYPFSWRLIRYQQRMKVICDRVRKCFLTVPGRRYSTTMYRNARKHGITPVVVPCNNVARMSRRNNHEE